MHARIFTKNTLLMHCYQEICNDIFETKLLGGDKLDSQIIDSIIENHNLQDEYSTQEIRKRSNLIYICDNETDNFIFGAAIVFIEKLPNGRPLCAHIKRFVIADYVKEHESLDPDKIKKMILQKIKDDFRAFNPDFNVLG